MIWNLTFSTLETSVSYTSIYLIIMPLTVLQIDRCCSQLTSSTEVSVWMTLFSIWLSPHWKLLFLPCTLAAAQCIVIGPVCGYVLLLGRLPKVNLIILEGGKCPSVRPSTKSFFDFNEIWYIGRGRWVMHDGMPYGRNQGQGQGHSREVDRQSPTGLIFIIINNVLI